jgi:hypothetical protein
MAIKKIIILFLFTQTIWAQQYNISEVEYFWGQTDPGYEQGVTLNAADGSFNSAIEEVIANYSLTQTEYGSTLFNIRVKDAVGNWGPTFKKAVFIGGVTNTPQEITITAFEYYFGNFDPGEGNGTPIVAFDGALDSAVEEVFRNQATWDVASGPILFNIRAKDADGNWGPVFKKTIFPYGANPDAELIAEGDSLEICPGSTVTLTYNGPFGYTPTWFDGSQENTITFTPSEEGSVNCSATLNGTTYIDSINISFKTQPDATISKSGTILACSSSNFALDAPVESNYSYQWYLNDNIITNATNASYLPTNLGSYTVKITDSATGCSKVSEPTILTSSFAVSTNGTNNFCGEQVLTVPLGSSNTYQWQKDGNEISGENSNTYTAKESGVFTCVITNGNCDFTTASLNLKTADLPTANTNQFFISGATLADLIVSGTNLKWYATLTSFNTIPSTTKIVNGETYHVSQTVNDCESIRLAITPIIDTTIPVITLAGEVSVDIEVGTTYTDAGATALDNYDGDITASIVTVNNVDTDVVGQYTLSYNVSDVSGNDAVQVTRTVNVVDTNIPVIILVGDVSVDIEVGITYTDAGATALDNYDGDITANIVTVNNVDADVVGQYTVSYNVSDASGNDAVQVNRTVNVVDTNIPVIILVGDVSVDIEVGITYTDAGATALDNYDGNITASIVTVNNVNADVVGQYTVSYNVSDASGNDAVQVTRTVNVDSNLSVDENIKSNLKVYPNPTSNVLNISVVNILNNQPYKIVDTLGKTILQGNLNEGVNAINVAQLSKGIYYFKVSNKKAASFIKE